MSKNVLSMFFCGKIFFNYKVSQKNDLQNIVALTMVKFLKKCTFFKSLEHF